MSNSSKSTFVFDEAIYPLRKTVKRRDAQEFCEGPVIEPDGAIVWRKDGRLHRDGGSSIVYPDGARAWHRYGALVLFEHPNGTRVFFLNDRPHRKGGPAVVCADGTRMYFRHGLRHRGDGPAVEYTDDREPEYWIDGVNQRLM